MHALKKTAKTWLEGVSLPLVARAARRRDSEGVPDFDPGPERVIDEGIAWLTRAQDRSSTADGGVAHHYSLIDGWSASYPETTGYILDTLLRCGREGNDPQILERSRRMLEWLVSIQFPDGAFQGGMVNQAPRLPAIFNTGQVLIGLTEGAQMDSRYREPMLRAADWLVGAQDADGCWRGYDTPFALPGEKVYETHVALALFRAAAVEPGRGYLEAAKSQVDWALTQQRPNGWLAKCCLTDHERPLTHTLGYALRGIVEAYLATQQDHYRDAACRTADGLLLALEPSGRLPGRLTKDWQPAADWVCLTGTSQIAESLLLLSGPANRNDYVRAAKRVNTYVRRTIVVDGPDDIRGGVKGSFPINGWYGRWQYPNWACKFMIDANRAELLLAT
jgi:hypothetical protein